MDIKVLLGVVALVIVVGGGYWFIQAPAAPTYEAMPVVETETSPAAGTMPAGTDAPDNGMVGGDAAPVAVDTYTLAQIAEHATAESCWSAVNGMVYDLTKWIPLHPGGEAKIKALCGKDGSTSFTNKHGGQEKPEATLASYKIGELAK